MPCIRSIYHFSMWGFSSEIKDISYISTENAVKNYKTFTNIFISWSSWEISANLLKGEGCLIGGVGWWNLSKSLEGVDHFRPALIKVEPDEVKRVKKLVQKWKLTLPLYN